MLVEIPDLLDADTRQAIDTWLAQASWRSGAESAGSQAREQKANEEMDQQCESWRRINEAVIPRLYRHPEFQRAALPHRVSAAFVSRYVPGMGYGPHIDDPVMGPANGRYRCDIATTVFLNDPSDYDGGELTIHSRFGPVTVKLPAGGAVVYPASSLHEVAPVTRGQRLVCALWTQSLVRDAHQREILADLADARSALQISAPKARVTQSVDHAYMNLVRLWSEV